MDVLGLRQNPVVRIYEQGKWLCRLHREWG